MALSTLTEGEVVYMRRLPPQDRIARYIEYFYEGQVDVIRGKAQVPADKPEWIAKLLHTGYVLEDEQPEGWEPSPEIAELNHAALVLAGELTDEPEAVVDTDDEGELAGDVDTDEEPVEDPNDVIGEIANDA